MNVFIISDMESAVSEQNCEAAEIDISDAGHMPINPMRFINQIRGLTGEQMADIGYALLDMCSAVYIVGGDLGQRSPIQNQYIGFARARGMRFFTPETLTYARNDGEQEQ